MEPTNRRRVVRALEVTLGSGRPFSSFGPGLGDLPADPLRPRRHLAPARRWWPTASRTATEPSWRPASSTRSAAWRPTGRPVPHRRARPSATGSCSPTSAASSRLDEAVDLAVRRTRQFARRQRAWFRRDPRITWVGAGDNPLVVLADAAARLDAADEPAEPHPAADQAPRPRATTSSSCSTEHEPADPPALARRACATADAGIGADGLLIGTDRSGRRRRPDHGPAQRRRLPGRDERQRHPLPGPGRGPRAAATDRSELRGRHRRRPARRGRRARSDARHRGRHRRHGPGQARRPPTDAPRGDRPWPSTSATPTSCCWPTPGPAPIEQLGSGERPTAASTSRSSPCGGRRRARACGSGSGASGLTEACGTGAVRRPRVAAHAVGPGRRRGHRRTCPAAPPSVDLGDDGHAHRPGHLRRRPCEVEA